MSRRRPLIAVYIEASRPFGVIYTGVTSNLFKRGWEHREGVRPGFTKRYGCKLLVWFEQHASITAAIRREKAIKSWNRAWKMQLIERENPDRADLYLLLCGAAPDPRVKPEDDAGG